MNKLQGIIRQNSGGKQTMQHWTLGNWVMFYAKDSEHARRPRTRGSAQRVHVIISSFVSNVFILLFVEH
jgi:hypothetical protein